MDCFAFCGTLSQEQALRCFGLTRFRLAMGQAYRSSLKDCIREPHHFRRVRSGTTAARQRL